MDIIPFELECRIWRLRHQSRWTLDRIAKHCGVSVGTVCNYLNRNRVRPKRKYTCKRRKLRAISLSGVFNV